jgi:hypothetical protein
MSDKNIYQILESLDAAQKSVKQLPALFKPRDTSPQLSGSYPGKNATQGYLVGEDQTMENQPPTFNRGGFNALRNKQDYLDKRDTLYKILTSSGLDTESKAVVKDRLATLDMAARQAGIIKEDEDHNPMAQAVTRRIVNQHPEWITKYGVEFLMQAIDDATEGEDDWEEIGSSDVSAYVHRVKDLLDDRRGSREEMDDRRPFAEESVDESLRPGEYHVATVTLDDGTQHKVKLPSDEGFRDPIVKHFEKQGRKVKDIDVDWSVRSDMYEGKDTATEDVISAVKKKLGDYLSDLSKEIKTDPDLKDKIAGNIDQISPSVKTIRTDDGHEIKIHGNEDDGFRISIKNKNIKTKFANLDEAVMACEMYCSRRRKQDESADYIEEA